MHLAKARHLLALAIAFVTALTVAAPAHAAPQPPGKHHAFAAKHFATAKHTHMTKHAKPVKPGPSAKQPRVKSAPRDTTPTVRYTNWAGYSAKAAAPDAAHAQWQVPTASWAGRNGYSNAWVGIGDGIGKNQLIQAGTEHDNVCVRVIKGKCAQSRSTYTFWFETFPQRSQELVTNLPVKPGDTVDVRVAWNAKKRSANFMLCNLTLNSCVTADRSAHAPNGIAEWVIERPSDYRGTPMALARTSPVTMRNMWVHTSSKYVNPVALQRTKMDMYSGNHYLATPSPMAKGAFTVHHQRQS